MNIVNIWTCSMLLLCDCWVNMWLFPREFKDTTKNNFRGIKITRHVFDPKKVSNHFWALPYYYFRHWFVTNIYLNLKIVPSSNSPPRFLSFLATIVKFALFVTWCLCSNSTKIGNWFRLFRWFRSKAREKQKGAI